MIRACIFDLGGTIVDKYSLSPFISFKNAFHKKKILISDDLIYKDMGMEKKEHIKLILQNKKVSERWNNLYNDYPNFKDVSEIYHLFNENQHTKESTPPELGQEFDFLIKSALNLTKIAFPGRLKEGLR